MCLKGDFILLQDNMEYNVEGSIFIYDILQGVYNKEYIKFKLRNVCSELNGVFHTNKLQNSGEDFFNVISLRTKVTLKICTV